MSAHNNWVAEDLNFNTQRLFQWKLWDWGSSTLMWQSQGFAEGSSGNWGGQGRVQKWPGTAYDKPQWHATVTAGEGDAEWKEFYRDQGAKKWEIPRHPRPIVTNNSNNNSDAFSCADPCFLPRWNLKWKDWAQAASVGCAVKWFCYKVALHCLKTLFSALGGPRSAKCFDSRQGHLEPHMTRATPRLSELPSYRLMSAQLEVEKANFGVVKIGAFR